MHKGLFCSKYQQSQLKEKMSCFLLGSQGYVNRARQLERPVFKGRGYPQLLSSAWQLHKQISQRNQLAQGDRYNSGMGSSSLLPPRYPTPGSPSGTYRSPLWPRITVKLVGICLRTNPPCPPGSRLGHFLKTNSLQDCASPGRVLTVHSCLESLLLFSTGSHQPRGC